MTVADDRPTTKAKVENGPVTIEVEGHGSPKTLLAQAMAAYREVAATPPVERPTPLPGTTDGDFERAGWQPIGFTSDVA